MMNFNTAAIGSSYREIWRTPGESGRVGNHNSNVTAKELWKQ